MGLTPYDSRRFARFLATATQAPPATRTLLLRAVVSEQRLVGVADWRLLGHVLFLNGLAVAPDHRGSGIGQRLLHDGIEIAQRLGCSGLELDVEEKNEPALALYRRAGLVGTGTSAWVELAPISPPPDGAAAGGGEIDEHSWRLRNWPEFLAHERAYGFGDLDVARGGDSVSVRLLPGGWRVSDAALGAQVTQAVGAAVGRWPDRVFRITRGKDAGDGTVLATFRRLRTAL